MSTKIKLLTLLIICFTSGFGIKPSDHLRCTPKFACLAGCACFSCLAGSTIGCGVAASATTGCAQTCFVGGMLVSCLGTMATPASAEIIKDIGRRFRTNQVASSHAQSVVVNTIPYQHQPMGLTPQYPQPSPTANSTINSIDPRISDETATI